MASEKPHQTAKTSKELASAVYDDFKRQAIDSAKKRAVAQRVDYDTFKNMVSVAHLKPIQAPKEQQGDGPTLPSWRFAADGSQLPDATLSADEGRLAVAAPQECPSTSGDFCRDWRRNCLTPQDKYAFLRLCGSDGLRSVFRIEVPADVLRDALAAMRHCWAGAGGGAAEGDRPPRQPLLDEATLIVQLLQALSSAGRFSLTVRLLGSDSKGVIESLFTGLQAALDSSASAAGGASAGGADSAHPALSGTEAGVAPAAVYDQPQLDALRKAFGLKPPVAVA